ncbi:cytochrome P450 [Ovoidimarina sediminis]|uniref:cytochrome P450 n=1 Tax=Ovoidimarina sediminis TaxID=3079856 RepID=UPI00290F95BB|nr:cytochrome P450 [Rhodophyticola sp. MJ-SS7]MDU8945206.1 cytochrome P450 [Rhodophyticola sp. MJ-SS7]
MLDLANPPTGFIDDPFPYYAQLREQAPVCLQPDGSVLLSRYADLNRVYRDTALFLSDKKPLFGPKFGEDTPLYRHHTTSLVFNDPPLHTRVRQVMVGALSPRALERLEPGLEVLVESLLDQLEPEGSPDLIEEFAGAIPVEVIGNLLAVPLDMRGDLRRWSLAILGALEPRPTKETLEDGHRAVEEFSRLMDEIIAHRRTLPGDPKTDVLTRLLSADGEAALSGEELVQNCIFILNAGHETTTNLIGNGLALIDAHPGLRRQCLAEPKMMPGLVEEILRLESPNQFGNRLTSADVEIGGIAVPAGTDLHLAIGAANRDPAAFNDPDRPDPTRRPNRHLAFAGGPHTCVGLTLARMEGRIALSRFLDRFPDFTICPEAVRSPRLRFRGFACLPAMLAP